MVCGILGSGRLINVGHWEKNNVTRYTIDPEEIATWIWDGHDQENVNLYIDFEPFLGGPIATEPASWSEVKAHYR